MSNRTPCPLLILLAALTPLAFSCSNAPGQLVIWFVSDRGVARDIYRMMPNGTQAVPISTNLGVNTFDIDPAGRVIVLHHLATGQLFRMDPAGSTATQITFGGATKFGPTLNPSGTRVAFVTNGDVWTMSVDGTNAQQITSTVSLESDPHWGPNDRIVYVRDQNIRAFSSDGSGDSQLTTSGAQNTAPRWSRDGERIVYSSADSGGIEVWIMNANGSNKTRVTNNSFNDFVPSLAPDGETVFWYQNQSGNFEVMRKRLGEVAETNLSVLPAVDLSPRVTQ